MKKKKNENQGKRGLAAASAETRAKVASAGGRAKHEEGRGLQMADKATRTRVARAGGKASQRGPQKKNKKKDN